MWVSGWGHTATHDTQPAPLPQKDDPWAVFCPRNAREAGRRTNKRKVLELLTKALEVPLLCSQPNATADTQDRRATAQGPRASGESSDMIHGAVTCSSIILNSHPLYV